VPKYKIQQMPARLPVQPFEPFTYRPEIAMPTETIGEYEIEYSGIQLPDSEDWGANLAIYGPSCNPMHRNDIFPSQRVAVDTVFHTEQEAEAEARVFAISMIEKGRKKGT
jgi:hypothetical protein